jgi:3-hydroxyisobutyrate dehydrogenase-like beta-hydroxyacid dehydrogenase
MNIVIAIFSPGAMGSAISVAGTGCDIIDGAIVGAPPQPGEKGPRIYVSGDQSDRASVLRTLGLDLRLIDGPIGAAAALKMSYPLWLGLNTRSVARIPLPESGSISMRY